MARVTTTAELRVLGGLQLHRYGEPVPIGGPKALLLLSILVAHAGVRLSVDRLTESLWADEAPKSPRHGHDPRVRSPQTSLDPRSRFVITHDAGGYRFEIRDGTVDADRFGAPPRSIRERSTPLPPPTLSTWHSESGMVRHSASSQTDQRSTGQAARLDGTDVRASTVAAEPP